MLGHRPRQDPVSCKLCRIKKIKCDREPSCSNCNARGVVCEYESRGKSVIRHSQPRSENSALLARLERLERIVAGIGGDKTGTKPQNPLEKTPPPSYQSPEAFHASPDLEFNKLEDTSIEDNCNVSQVTQTTKFISLTYRAVIWFSFRCSVCCG